MKEKLQNILLAPLGWALDALAFMPWWWIYFNADCLYYVAYHVVRYRVKIVRRNLATCFPEKGHGELRKIERQFYHQFANLFFETVKLLHISDADIKRHMVFHNVDFIDDGIERGQSVMMYAAHLGNWEWIPSIVLWFRESTRARGNVLGQAYKPLRNKWFDRLFLRLRTRYSQCFPSHQILRTMIRNKMENHHMALGFISDQHPHVTDQGHVIEFMHHPTAMITGTEAIARKLDMRVGYFYMRRHRRGYYDCTLVPMCEHAAAEPEGSITDRYARLLEHNIKECPSMWLWTHDRWKRPVQLPRQQAQSEIETEKSTLT